MDPVLSEANLKIDEALRHLQKELSNIRAGRANPTLIEDLQVSAYGSRMKLVELGTISTPQPSLLQITAWDAGVVRDIEKAILESNLGLNPATDGTTIRLAIPPLTEERREELVKVAQGKGEDCKVSIRQTRGDNRDKWVGEEKRGEISEDELRRREKLLQDLINQSVATVEEYVQAKIEELRQI